MKFIPSITIKEIPIIDDWLKEKSKILVKEDKYSKDLSNMILINCRYRCCTLIKVIISNTSLLILERSNFPCIIEYYKDNNAYIKFCFKHTSF